MAVVVLAAGSAYMIPMSVGSAAPDDVWLRVSPCEFGDPAHSDVASEPLTWSIVGVFESDPDGHPLKQRRAILERRLGAMTRALERVGIRRGSEYFPEYESVGDVVRRGDAKWLRFRLGGELR